MYVSDEGQVGRVTALADDGRQVWIQLANGSVANASASAPLELKPGDVVFVTDGDIVLAPDEVWPEDGRAHKPFELLVGVVSLKAPDVTLLNVGSAFRRIPTSDVEYEKGYTVEATEARGVQRVLDRKPIRLIERDDFDGDLSEFKRQPGDQALTFEDFGGLRDVVRRARELIELPMLHADKLDAIGARPVKGVLFTGSPGTGKTMLARIIADVAGASFYEISGPTVISKWVGESEQLLRRIFTDAAENAPSIIFFDEIDSVAGRRTEQAHEASKRVVAQLLTLMDGFTAKDRVTIIAATNRPQDIDVALLRPGRFDWEIEFPLPEVDDREEMLRVSARGLKTDEPLPYAWIAANTEAWSAADLTAIWREAALVAVADGRAILVSEDVLEGHARVDFHRGRLTVIEVDVE